MTIVGLAIATVVRQLCVASSQEAAAHAFGRLVLLGHHHGLFTVTLTPAHETLVLAAGAKLIFASFVHHEFLGQVSEHGFLALLQQLNELLAYAEVRLEVLPDSLLAASGAPDGHAAALLFEVLAQRAHGEVTLVAQAAAELGALIVLHVRLQILIREQLGLFFIVVTAAVAHVRERARVQTILHDRVQFLQVIALALAVRAASDSCDVGGHSYSGPGATSRGRALASLLAIRFRNGRDGAEQMLLAMSTLRILPDTATRLQRCARNAHGERPSAIAAHLTVQVLQLIVRILVVN